MEPGFIQRQKIKLAKKIIDRLMPPPVRAEHWEYSCIFSAKDDNSVVSKNLLDIVFETILLAPKIDLSDLTSRFNFEPINPDPTIWPGEHYKLLAAFVKAKKPKIIIEIGTSIGTSSLSMLKYLAEGSVIYTFDIIPWDKLEKTLFNKTDFETGALVQFTDDLSLKENYIKHIKLFEMADLIFVDAKKDGIMEQVFIDLFNETRFDKNPIVFFDDIKNWQMLKIWRDITHPKLDLTSFGHFTGTGIVEWNNIKNQ
ncbi:MAG: hypothetical protein WCX31_04295 [Salinivirgaceae bacterium]